MHEVCAFFLSVSVSALYRIIGFLSFVEICVFLLDFWTFFWFSWVLGADELIFAFC